VTTLPDLRDIAQRIGGDRVESFAIAKGYQDPHFVDAKPSYMIRLQNADLFVQVGLDLEIGWAPQLLEGARNSSILYGAPGYVDASKGIQLLQVPTDDPAKLRAQGDIHIYGNPHYWLDPLNGKLIARNIYDGLVRISPEDQAYFAKNLQAFDAQIDQALQRWQAKMAPYRGAKIVAFHNSWPYFERRFGLVIAGFIEPKPGIPPTPKHTVEIIELMKREGIKVIIIEPYYSRKPAELVAQNVGGKVVELAPMVEGMSEAKDYLALFDYNISQLVAAFQEVGVGKPMIGN